METRSRQASACYTGNVEEHRHNLLPHHLLPHVRRRKAFWKYAAYAGLAAFATVTVLSVAVALPALAAAREMYAQANAGRDDLFAAKTSAEKLDFAAASQELGDAADRFAAAQAAHAKLKLAARLPSLGKEVEAAGDLVEGAHEASVALKAAVDVGADLIAVFRSGAGAGGAVPGLSGDDRPVSQLTREEKRALLQQLSQAPDRLGSARASLDDAIAAWDRVPVTPLTQGIVSSLGPYKAQLAQLRDLLASKDLSTLAILPQLLGYPEPKTYLFLMLNNTELRPGGGFIGTYGILKVADGEIASFFTDDVYALDGPSEAYLHETPPAPLQRYLHGPGWFLRDANWSPDYLVSALEAERFYHLEGGTEQVDGVIGVTPTVISKLLALTGPVTVDGSTFTSDNVTDELEFQVEKAFAANGTPMAQRKDVVGKLGEELLHRLLGVRLSDLSRLASVAQDAVDQKQLMVSFNDPSLQAFADARDWTGRLRTVPGDQLSVIDANLASLKTDAVVDKRVAYTLRPDGGSWIARAAITYRNTGHFTWKTTRYRTYTRFYAPLGSVFLKGEGMMQDDKLNDPGRHAGTIDVGTELGHAVFGGFISVEPGETRTLAVDYRVSDAVARMIRDGRYDLDVRKQLGTLANGLTLDLDFGKNVARATPPEPSSEWGDAQYRLSTDLRLDRHFSVGLQ